jgi:membrane-associated phospholipid phosphatase
MVAIRARFFIPVLLVCLPSFSFAYDGDPVTNAVKDIGYLRAERTRLAQPRAAYLAGGLLGTGVLIYSFDAQLRHIARKNRTSSLDDLALQAEKIGNGGYELAMLGAGAGAGYAFGNDKLKDTALRAVEAFLAANAIGTVVKYSVGRTRPYGEDGKRSFKPFAFKTVSTSFPSGHTTGAFSVASVLASSYDSLWAGIAAYGAASATALQRVYSDKHWASDVFFGAVLGTVTGRAVVRGAAGGRSEKSAYLLPVFGPDYSGVLAAVRF